MKDSLIQLFSRDLERLEKEIAAYSDEQILWTIEKDISNSAGHLAIHIVGNLNHFVGGVLGNNGYVRDRPKEFNGGPIAKSAILEQIQDLKTILHKVFSSLKDQDFNEVYPINVFKKEMSTEYFLIHLYGHLNYHLGQINYHRRILDKC